MNYFEKRRLQKHGREMLHHARHVRRTREDVTDRALVQQLIAAEEKLYSALKARDSEHIQAAINAVGEIAGRVMPERSLRMVRENLEMIAVAVVIAMGFRAYFLQPFKIPTGSMQPTLYGVHYRPDGDSGWMAQFPMNLARMAVWGESSYSIQASGSGQASKDRRAMEGSPVDQYFIGNSAVQIQKDLRLRFAPDTYVVGGQLLASGSSISGDHIFVDKVRWNFQRPKRGQVMVFQTGGIEGLPPDTHYIKRMVGLPGERISVNPPYLVVNGMTVREPAEIRRIEDKAPGYNGYLLTGRPGTKLAKEGDALLLSPNEYLGFGDNTQNSYDGRYWGPVPEKNLVGPALFVYWPFSARWGLVR
jgi:signal peptidase I